MNIKNIDFGSPDCKALKNILLVIAAGHLDSVNSIGRINISHATQEVSPAHRAEQTKRYSYSLMVKGGMPDSFANREIKNRYIVPLTQCLKAINGATVYIIEARCTSIGSRAMEAVLVLIKTVTVPK